MIKIDSAGDYFYRGPYGTCHWVILGRIYYLLVDEKRDGTEFIEFEGLDDHQGKIFALCIEGWL